MKDPRNNQKEMVEIGNTIMEMKDAFDGLICRLDRVKERVMSLRI
jgi:hypothetical protein